MTIWKYPLDNKDRGTHKLKVPRGSRPISAHLQKQDAEGIKGTLDRVCVWLEVDPEQDLVEVIIYDVNTGGTVPENSDFIGTVLSRDEELVSHLYWRLICPTGLMKP